MEIILLERVDNLGQMGDVVTVKNGYARNFLLPQRKALRATDANKAHFEAQRAQLEAENLERRNEAEQVAAKLEGFAVVLIRQASESLQLYGSVTARDIASAATEAGVGIDRRQVKLDRPIKTIGLHEVVVTLHPEVSVNVTVNVARSDDEAKFQAKGGVVTAEGEEDLTAEEAAAEAAAEAAEEVFENPEAEIEAIESQVAEESEAEAEETPDEEADEEPKPAS
jgi:large subunit ribosomal protein L9